MINRRKFVASLGATTLLSSAPRARATSGTSAAEDASRGRSRISLNGEWERYIGPDLYDVVQVPSSLHPSGLYRLTRDILLPRLTPNQRAFLHFEAINYHGRVSVNGEEVGTTIPYVPYDFECTRQVKEGRSSIAVAVADLVPDPTGAGKDHIALGLNPGWEGYGGIIRDASIEVRPAAYIDNARLSYELTGDYSQAVCQIRLDLSSASEVKGQLQVSLFQGRSEVAKAEQVLRLAAGESDAEVTLILDAPALWSPEAPNLYELQVSLSSPHGEDAWSCRTGFRRLETRGPQFLLNGKPLILNGVGRHDMWREQGFTLTRRQAEQDMRMIKMLGCNFVRLVHYPHDRYIVELADELGLLVTEEPGYWNMDFNKMPQSMIDLGYRIMEKTIRRDWNSPAVFAWLLSNECTLTVESLREGISLCKRLDPLRRFVSVANSMSKEKAKPILEAAGVEFFTTHPYTHNLDEFNAEAEYYGPGKPLVFTEWGGKAIGQSPLVMQNTVDRILDLQEAKQLAGHAFWSWQDMREYSRIDPEMRNGVLESGVVTEGREPREVVYLELARLFQGLRQEPPTEHLRPHVLPLKEAPAKPGATFQVVELQSMADRPEAKRSWAAFVAAMQAYWPKTPMARDQWERTGKKFHFWQQPKLQIAGIPFSSAVVDGYVRPLVLTSDVPEFTIPVGADCSRLHFLGQAMFPVGYPLEGRRGEIAATYTVRFAGGKTQQLPVRHGIEVAQANQVFESTRIDPIAVAAQPAAVYAKDLARELYQVRLWSVPVGPGRVESVHCQLNGPQPALTIFAMTVEM
jgi:hypothetical protein